MAANLDAQNRKGIRIIGATMYLALPLIAFAIGAAFGGLKFGGVTEVERVRNVPAKVESVAQIEEALAPGRWSGALPELGRQLTLLAEQLKSQGAPEFVCSSFPQDDGAVFTCKPAA